MRITLPLLILSVAVYPAFGMWLENHNVPEFVKALENVAKQRQTLNAVVLGSFVEREEAAVHYDEAVSAYQALLNNLHEEPRELHPFVKGYRPLRLNDTLPLRKHSLKERTVRLAPLSDQSELVQRHWLSERAGGPPLSAQTGENFDPEMENEVLLPAFWPKWQQDASRTSMLRRHAMAELGPEATQSQLQEFMGRIPNDDKKQLTAKLDLSLNSTILDGGGHPAKLARQYDISMGDQHKTLTELFYRGIVPPMHFVDVKALILNIKNLYHSDPQLFKDIVCSLDLSDIFVVPRKYTAGKHGMLQTNKPFIDFMFLLQAIEAHSIAGVTLALWDLRKSERQAGFETAEIVIAQYFAVQNGFKKADELLDDYFKRAMYGWMAENQVPLKLSKEEQKYFTTFDYQTMLMQLPHFKRLHLKTNVLQHEMEEAWLRAPCYDASHGYTSFLGGPVFRRVAEEETEERGFKKTPYGTYFPQKLPLGVFDANYEIVPQPKLPPLIPKAHDKAKKEHRSFAERVKSLRHRTTRQKEDRKEMQ